MNVGRLGIFSVELRLADVHEAHEAAIELEELGYSAAWIPGGPAGGGIIETVTGILGATRSMIAAPAVLNVFVGDPVEVAKTCDATLRAYPDRFLLGLGASHANFVEARGQSYSHPVEAVERYLDALDEAVPPVARDRRILAALGPRMLELARDRSGGTLPYLMTPDYTSTVRQAIGPNSLLIQEQAVLLETDRERAHAVGRRYFSRYLDRRNYTNNLRRQGFTDADFTGGPSDRLIDALVAWGDLEIIENRMRAHFDAGADHVCLQVLRYDEDLTKPPLAEWRELAPLSH